MDRRLRSGVVHVVDADASVSEALVRLLDSGGFDARPFRSLDVFLDACAVAHPVCAVLDIPTARSASLLARATLQVRALQFPVVALSADDDERTIDAARALGACAFYRKPIDGAALLDAIDWMIWGRTPAV